MIVMKDFHIVIRILRVLSDLEHTSLELTNRCLTKRELVSLVHSQTMGKIDVTFTSILMTGRMTTKNNMTGM
jgi:hypothetical protein